MEPFIGMIMPWPCNFEPMGWAFCDGRLLQIAQNSALFSLLGTTYGGNGTTTFALPDLRGRVIAGAGNGPGLQPVTLGDKGGQESVTLSASQMPSHTHTVAAATQSSTPSPANGFPGPLSGTTSGGETIDAVGYSPTAGGTMNPGMIGVSGGNQPHENRQPYTGINYIIALQGIYPSRS